MAEYILEDWYGKEQTFDKETIYVQGKDGELMPFTHGAGNPVIEPLKVTENGTYEVPDGVDGYSPVVVNVAGSGDSGATLENPIVASGIFAPTSATGFILNHNLGVVPDCIEIYNLNGASGTVGDQRILYSIGFRTGLAFNEYPQSTVLQMGSGGATWVGGNDGIDGSNSWCPFRNATETSVTIGASTVGYLDTTAEYQWSAKRLLP